jgi:BTB/POZ domain-containing protein 1/2
MVDRKIFAVGFGLYGSIHGPMEYQATIQIIHTASGKVCGSNNTSFSSDGSNYTFRVMFKEPVEILPNTSYIASATLKVNILLSVILSNLWGNYFYSIT